MSDHNLPHKEVERESGNRWSVTVLAVLTALITAGVLAVFAASSTLADFLPHDTWFAIGFVALGAALIYALRWVVRRYRL